MQAIILAAGMGKRLKELTNNNTKCMVKVNGVTMIERMLSQLDQLNLSSITVVIGYKGRELQDFIQTLPIRTPINYVRNDVYHSTNNIYSLYLARNYLLNEDTLLLESDLIFEDSILRRLVDDPYPSLALVAKYESWMDGTVVTLDGENNITSFVDKSKFEFSRVSAYYKTVNIYKFSREFSNSHYVPFLEAYSKALGNNEYYEQVLKVITLLEKPGIKAAVLQDEAWYEIDDIQDLDIAESIFSASRKEKLAKFESRYGGYWRYPDLLDFCYLVNPYYPSPKLIDEMKTSFGALLCNYPSGMKINGLLAAKLFNMHPDQIVVGNGASELIKALMERTEGKIGLVTPTFEEYPNRRKPEDIIAYTPQNPDFSYTADDLIGYFGQQPISTLLLINPDNPSGNYIPKADVLRIAEWARQKAITLIVDESFVDFADREEAPTLIDPQIIAAHPALIVVKSISKSYGVPGLRLGILVSGNGELIANLKKDVSIWNINSFAEFFMQIFEKYRGDYANAIQKLHAARREFADKLRTIKNLRVIPSQANYIMCELTGGCTAAQLAETLLCDYEILIKQLSRKKGLNGEYIRLAVRNPQDNDRLLEALKRIL